MTHNLHLPDLPAEAVDQLLEYHVVDADRNSDRFEWRLVLCCFLALFGFICWGAVRGHLVDANWAQYSGLMGLCCSFPTGWVVSMRAALRDFRRCARSVAVINLLEEHGYETAPKVGMNHSGLCGRFRRPQKLGWLSGAILGLSIVLPLFLGVVAAIDFYLEGLGAFLACVYSLFGLGVAGLYLGKFLRKRAVHLNLTVEDVGFKALEISE